MNALTCAALCPDSRQPALKHAAVKVLKAELPWRLQAMAWLPASEHLRVRAQLQSLTGALPYASCVPFAAAAQPSGVPARCGVLLRAASHTAPPLALLTAIEALLRLDGPDVIRYGDPRRGQHRAVQMARATQQLEGFLLAGDTQAAPWVGALLESAQSAQKYGRAILAAQCQPPRAVAPRGAVVCTCLQVTEPDIEGFLRTAPGNSHERLVALQARLQCGTQCGSCKPQLQKMLRMVPAPAAMA